MELQYEKDSKERIPYEHYMELFQEADPEEISARTGIPYDKQSQTFNLHLLGVAYQVHFPDYVVTHDPESTVGYYPLEAAINARILVLRYLVEGHSAPSTGKYLTYRETPWGTVYLKQFQGRCLMRLAYGFGFKMKKFAEIFERLGAKKLTYGDVSYEIEFINDHFVRFILWAGDDEFPPSSQILFSDNFPLSFETYDLAVVGDISITTLKKMQ